MVNRQTTAIEPYTHLLALDGFRASLALWVYLGHLAAAVGFQNYLLDLHPLAVDLFMVLSGFLMVHTWKEPLNEYRLFSKNTLSFYGNRFFRIVPLYYFLLLVCYLWSPTLAQMHNYSLTAIPPVWSHNISGYIPNTSWNFDSFRWFWTHASFLFGLVPGMENSTPLPDWSLSLEMQFYLILPLLLICLKKVPVILITALCALIAFASPKLFGNYLDAGILTHFGQPSFLPYRLNAFMAGMLPALFLQQGFLPNYSRKTKAMLIIAALLCIAPLSKPVILAYGLFLLLVLNTAPLISRVLSIKPLRFLGKISYSIYLCHILIVIPIVYWLIKDTGFMDLRSGQRFALSLLITLPLVIIFSFGLYQYIERVSIQFWKDISLKLK